MLKIHSHSFLILSSLFSLIYFSSQLRDLRIIESGEEEQLKEEEPSIIKPPGFSQISGFYQDNFKLKLKAEEGTTIYYTVDASDPRTSKTSKEFKDYILIYDKTNEKNVYANIHEGEDSPVRVTQGNFNGPVYPVDKAFVVRAVAKNTKGEFSEINSKTYFVTNEDLEIYKDLTVVSIVTNPENLFDPDTGIYVTGTMYQEWKKSEDYDPKRSPWDKNGQCNFFQRGEKWEREALVTIFDKGEKIVQQNMGLRIKGASTRNNPGKSFNLHAKKKYGKSTIEAELFKDNYDINGNLITSYKSFSLRCVYENNRIKDKFGWDLFKTREGLTSADMRISIVFLNGEYWGLYVMQEKVDDNFIESNYLIPHKNVALSKNGETEEGSKEEWDNLTNFASLYSKKKDLSDKKVFEEVKNYIDIDSFIELFATGIYISIGDWPKQNSGEWRNTGEIQKGNKYSDGKWRFMLFDLDYTMGNKFAGVGEVSSDNFKFISEKKSDYYPGNLFIGLLKNNTEFQNKFINVYCDYANEVYNPDKVNKIIEEYRTNWVELVAYSQLRWWGWSSKLEGFASYKQRYLQALNTLSDFFERRPLYTFKHMKDFLGLKGDLVDLTIEVKGRGRVQINSIIPKFVDGKWKGKYFSRIPISIKAIPYPGYNFKEWSGFITSNEEKEEVTLLNAQTIIATFD